MCVGGGVISGERGVISGHTLASSARLRNVFPACSSHVRVSVKKVGRHSCIVVLYSCGRC